MAEAKRAGSNGKTNGSGGAKSSSPGNGAQGAAPGGKTSGQQAGGQQGAASLLGRADQLGAILSRGLDLAEAGLSLGLTVLTRVGGVAQQRVFDGLSVGGGMSQARSEPPPGAQPSAPYPGSPPAPDYPAAGEPEPAPTQTEAMQYAITNRLPLAPGAPLKISFSLNNDSATDPKRVSLHLEGLVGELNGGVLEAAGFAIKPATKTIGPLDFEKFVLQGALPPETPPDIYQGWVVVQEAEEIRIPVRLMVGG